MSVINKELHLIWFGSIIPDTVVQKNNNDGTVEQLDRGFFSRFKQWGRLNPDWIVTLWFDSRTFPRSLTDWQNRSKEEIENARRAGAAQVAEMVQNAGVPNLRCNDKCPGTADTPLNEVWYGELKNLYTLELESVGRPNYAAMSDILRIQLMIERGGLYVDTDISPSKPLGLLDAPADFFVNKVLTGVRNRDYTNDLLAAPAGHSFFKRCADRIAEQYRTLNIPRGVKAGDDKAQRISTIERTGPGILLNVLLNDKYVRENDGTGTDSFNDADPKRPLVFPRGFFKEQTGSEFSWA